ncbi:hypothetical protein [Clostridium sp. UBA4395]|uniref:hypothetical protein n=1 Tax=Clostridium sp. UBA4395 TaxID=1946360 RepID=UPI00321646E1
MKKVLCLLLTLLALLTSTGSTVFAETEVGPRAIASSCPYGTKHKGVLQGIGIVRYESTNKIFEHYGHYYLCKCGSRVVTTGNPHLLHDPAVKFYTQSFKENYTNGTYSFYMTKMDYTNSLPTWEFFSSNNPLSIESEGM